MKLGDIGEGMMCTILKVRGRTTFRKRIMEMGFVPGRRIKVLRKAPFNDPVEYELMGYKIALRRSEANLIEVAVQIDTEERNSSQTYDSVRYPDLDNSRVLIRGKAITVALLGNPTSGKTLLFNQLTGSSRPVGNYSGVTVDKISAIARQNGYEIYFTDMPGIYSLSGGSPGTRIIRDHIADEIPDIILNVVDTTNLERNLYLTTEIIDLGFRTVVALNMLDEFKKQGTQFDYDLLGKMTGTPMVSVSALKKTGLTELLDRIIQIYEDRDTDVRHVHVYYGELIEKSIGILQDKIRIPGNSSLTDVLSSRFLALKLLEKDTLVKEKIRLCANASEINSTSEKEIARIEKFAGDQSDAVITSARFAFVSGAMKETYKGVDKLKRTFSDRLDAIFTHKWFGLPIFAIFIWLMFTTTFKLGSYPMHWIDTVFAWMISMVQQGMPDGVFKDLIANGVVSGIGGVMVFLPNILILYLFISIMEETGYMARAVFLMDRIMHKIGLHGKSFIPLVMGFGCNVPAIMATRMLENRSDRIVTVLINPFISCNARLPVYILFITAFFSENPGLILLFVYFTGIGVAVITALILKKTFFRGGDTPFVMELPQYRLPSRRAVARQMGSRTGQYLKKIAGVILIASIIFWALGYFPQKVEYSRDYDRLIAEKQRSLSDNYQQLLSMDPIDAAKVLTKINSELAMYRMEQKSEHLEKSYIGQIGHLIEPLVRPLGFEWRLGVAIVSGIPAKEIIVSTLAVLSQVDNSTDEPRNTLASRIKEQTYSSGDKIGEKIFSPAVALAFMVFVLLYFPCIGTLIAVVRESKSWSWGLFSLFYSFAVAWILSFIVYRLADFFYGI